jgi:chloramphenicol-sensitive protein RarD
VESGPNRASGVGLAYGVAAYAMWGVFPIYFHALAHLSPWVIVCHRILWSAVFLAVIVTFRREWRQLMPVLRHIRSLRLLAAGGVLIAFNWLVFIHAVTSDQVLEASLGYFINPLLSVALGMIFLRERLRGWQWAAVMIATVAVVSLAWRGERFPWIALALAGSFGFYGLVRKTLDIHSLHALLVETTLLLPVAFLGLAWLPGAEARGICNSMNLSLLAFTGVITATPLLFFGAAVRRLKLSTMGFLQYVGPSLQFLVAALIFREPLDRAKLASFGICWAAIVIYIADSVVAHNSEPR